MKTDVVFENEKWWQEHGGEWGSIVDDRKTKQPLYSIQEVMLSNYFASIPQSKVLEFGVGFGRHIEYLKQLSNIEIYGVDQSSTMLESLKERLDAGEDLLRRMILIEPRQKLPFPDNYFDVVYTVSVLIHIQPKHIPEIIKELIRVAKHRIIHIENNLTNEQALTAPDHNGCWAHPIIKNYKDIGYTAEILEKVVNKQDIYVVDLSKDKRYDFNISPVTIERLYQIDKLVLPHMQFLEGEVGWMRKELLQRQEDRLQLSTTIEELKSEKVEFIEQVEQLKREEKELKDEKQQLLLQVEDLETKNQQLFLQVGDLETKKQQLFLQLEYLETEKQQFQSMARQYEGMLNEVYSSAAWKLITRLRKSKLLYMLSKPAISILKKKEQIIVKNPESDNLLFFRNQISDKALKPVVAIHHPDWLGVSNSTNELFEETLQLREVYSQEEAQEIATLLYKAAVKKVVFSGFAIGYPWVIRSLKKINPEMKILLFWHGNTTHMYEDYSWFRHQEILDMCREGLIDTWGFAKKSMADLYENLGVKTAFVMNRVPIYLSKWKKEQISNKVRIGLYASGTTWNKNAYTQIAAASLIEQAELFAIPCNERMKQFAAQLGVSMHGIEHSISRDELWKSLTQNSINFYVTFTECAPLIPLESLGLGVPCLTGPNHHYFSGTELEQYLVVHSPDDPTEIARKAVYALENKEKILHLYVEWVEEYNKTAEKSVVDFIGK
ncbi:hypothetical protein AM501_25140 [Aneurinibacillus migulanus]|uniref:methyltransferase domain-containing protein n=1 Tax=Aneurinibacillus migulanus TaxID=47500 RepID=UPI0005B822AF|nr:methyltransferase domain-containing protein [Aneurinibacillus migulanus]KIV53537.1 hypothetical protein TS64_19130 [Aneurinibacillus migulanus]KPD05575.1 hypothetical protein AM501_25140 [Aneurinibacillus migulanus]